ncbi:MAG: aminotransferase class I/II-fold pyridoxal phosphate-dependent enzyme [Chitinophagaceae bacterium]
MIYAETPPGRTLNWEGREYLFFSGYSYLGMGYCSEFSDWIKEGVQLYGPVYPSSRIGNVRLRIFDELETALARQTGFSQAISFSSGYLAAKAAVEYLHQNGPVIYAPGIHPALQKNNSSLHFSTWKNWVEQTIQTINQHPQLHFQVIMESINPLTGKIYDFMWLAHLKERTTILIDDSHGIGILGDQGEGIMALLPKKEQLDFLVCFSLAKAFGIGGGAIAGTQMHIQPFRSSHHFTASTGISPAFAYAFLHSREIYLSRRNELFTNIRYFLNHLPLECRMIVNGQLPIFPIHNDQFNLFCQQQGILLSSFPYPDPQGKVITRIILNSLHTKKDLETLISCIGNFQTTYGKMPFKE